MNRKGSGKEGQEDGRAREGRAKRERERRARGPRGWEGRFVYAIVVSLMSYLSHLEGTPKDT